jgi:hypothetical protein
VRKTEGIALHLAAADEEEAEEEGKEEEEGEVQ